MRYLLVAASVSAVLGAMALFEAARRPSWVDASGLLHEPFAWMASGRILLFFSVMFLAVASALWLARTMRRKLTG